MPDFGDIYNSEMDRLQPRPIADFEPGTARNIADYPTPQVTNAAGPQQQDPQQQAAMQAMLDPFTQGDVNRLQEVNGALSHLEKQVSSGILSPEEGQKFRQQIDAIRLPLLAKQGRQLQAQKGDQKAQLMEGTALAWSMDQAHAQARTQAFPNEIARYMDPLTGQFAHFFQSDRGKWEQIKLEPTQAPQAGETESAPGGTTPAWQAAQPQGPLGRLGQAAAGLGARGVQAIESALSAGAAVRDVAGAAGVLAPGEAAQRAAQTAETGAYGLAAGLGAEGGPAAPAAPSPPPGAAPAAGEASAGEGPAAPKGKPAAEAAPDVHLAVRAALTGATPEERQKLDEVVAGTREDVYNQANLTLEQRKALEAHVADSRAREAQSIIEEAKGKSMDPVELAAQKREALRAAGPSTAELGAMPDRKVLEAKAKEEAAAKAQIQEETLHPIQEKHLWDEVNKHFAKIPMYRPREMTHADQVRWQHTLQQRQRDKQAMFDRMKAPIIAERKARRLATEASERSEKQKTADQQAKAGEAEAVRKEKEALRTRERDEKLLHDHYQTHLKAGLEPKVAIAKATKEVEELKKALGGGAGTGAAAMPVDQQEQALREAARNGNQNAILQLTKEGKKPPW